MGLDMYLHRHVYSNEQSKLEITQKKINTEKPLLKDLLTPSDLNQLQPSIDIVCIHWKKVNPIHKWFVDNVQYGVDDNKPHNVSYKQLATLKDVCLSVISKHDDKYSKLILPPQKGIFFGNTEIDDDYYRMIKNAYSVLDKEIQLLNKVIIKHKLHKTNFSIHYVYKSSW